MPIYEYQCKKCGAQFELLVKNTAEQVACTSCGSIRVERLLSTFSASTSGATPDTACGVDAGCGSACYSGGACPLSS